MGGAQVSLPRINEESFGACLIFISPFVYLLEVAEHCWWLIIGGFLYNLDISGLIVHSYNGSIGGNLKCGLTKPISCAMISTNFALKPEAQCVSFCNTWQCFSVIHTYHTCMSFVTTLLMSAYT